MSVYKTKINSFDDDLEKIKKETEEKKKEKEEEETLLQTRKKELEEIQNNRTNIENLIRQAEEKKKANTEKRKELQELEEQERKLETAIKDKKNSIKENTDILKELETEEKILEEKKKIVDEKKATRIVGDKTKELQKVLKRIDKIKAGDIFYCFSNLETFSNFEKENYDIFKDDIRRYFNSAKNEIEFAIKNDDKILETINSFCPDDVFERMKALNKIAVEDYGFEDEEIEIDKGRGYGD